MNLFAWIAIAVLWGTVGLPWWSFALLFLCGFLISVIIDLLEKQK